MYSYEYDMAVDRLRDLRAEADSAARARRLRAARRWARRRPLTATPAAARSRAATRPRPGPDAPGASVPGLLCLREAQPVKPGSHSSTTPR